MPSPRPGGGGPAGGPGGGGSQDGGPSDPGGGPGGGEPGGGAGSTGASGPGGAAGPDGGRVARLRRRAEAVRERAGAGLEAARRRSRAVDTAFLAYERDRQAVGGVLAGAVAFRLFVYTLPLVLGALTLLGTLRSIDPDHPRALGHDLGMSAYVIDSVAAAAEQSQRGIWLLVPLAAWAVYSGGLGVVRVMRAVHALAWGQPVTRPASNLTAALAAFGLAVAAFALVGSLQALRERSEGLGLGLALLGFAPFAGLWLVTSLLMPRDPAARWTALVPGAVLVGVAAWGAHLASVYYLARRVQKASELYGSLGVAAAILAWLYLLGRVMVGSAMLDAALWHRGRQARREG